jgi:serine/threonine protein kinase
VDRAGGRQEEAVAEESDAVKRAQKRIGTVLKGKYTLDRLLGAGGMAAVYAATHRNQKQFAVKMLHAELSVHEDIRARFLREGYAANSVKHPGAVAVMDDDTAEDGAAFLVMELLEGTTIEGWWEQAGQRLDVESVLRIAWQLLDVLAAAHAKAIVHRDIKPANLFVTRNGELKVLDFGIARVRAIAASDQGATGTGCSSGRRRSWRPSRHSGRRATSTRARTSGPSERRCSRSSRGTRCTRARRRSS